MNTPELCVALLRVCQELCAALPDQGTLTVDLVLTPPGDPGRFDIQIDGTNHAANVGDGGSTGPETLDVGTHTVGVNAAGGTSLADYTISIGGDCSSNGTVILPGGSTRTCVITAVGPPPEPEPPDDRAQCLDDCNQQRDLCMQDPQMMPQFCVSMLNHCKALCPPN